MDELDECKCSDNCSCGEDCECTKANKCNDNCSCDNDCKCCEECACGEDCHCDENNKCCDNCTCETDCEGVDNCKCGSDCNCSEGDDSDEESKCECDDDCSKQECGDECDCSVEDDKCQCGCGESLEEENIADAYFKQLLSLQAEFDNYRKRTQNDISKAYSNGFNEAITQFLPALDSFKMATEYITDSNTLMGIQYIEKGILSTLEKIGVHVIDCSGKFDPEVHQAIGSEVSAEHEGGDIIKECFKGFKMGDKVIRYSQVIVAK